MVLSQNTIKDNRMSQNYPLFKVISQYLSVPPNLVKTQFPHIFLNKSNCPPKIHNRKFILLFQSLKCNFLVGLDSTATLKYLSAGT